MTNLYTETLQVLKNYDLTFDDVIAVQYDEKVRMSVDNFIEIAMSTFYDSGYGSAEIYESLMIIGKDWWLERAEYDGAEWWRFMQYPIILDEITENVETVMYYN